MCEYVFDIGIPKTGAHCHFRFMFALTGHAVRDITKQGEGEHDLLADSWLAE